VGGDVNPCCIAQLLALTKLTKKQTKNITITVTIQQSSLI
jgi:hypothetical protein